MTNIIKKAIIKLNELEKKTGIKLSNPILIGGGALEYYNIRKSGHDLDFIIKKTDMNKLLKKNYKLNLFGGKTIYDVDATFTNIEKMNIDLAITIYQYDYNYMLSNAIKQKYNDKTIYIVSIENLLLMKTLASEYSLKDKKHMKDVKLIIQKGIIPKQYNK